MYIIPPIERSHLLHFARKHSSIYIVSPVWFGRRSLHLVVEEIHPHLEALFVVLIHEVALWVTVSHISSFVLSLTSKVLLFRSSHIDHKRA
ncbi:hypothetical protein Scep_028944 [Stephania cephalantha]|uniref:Uncharacterized protein n=1 Tax=Stephania cephalantha TaxID=152367 RepID=A0AAP0HMA2_9MAGN